MHPGKTVFSLEGILWEKLPMNVQVMITITHTHTHTHTPS